MSREDFNNLVDTIVQRSLTILVNKSTEYSVGEDAFKSFKNGLSISLHTDAEKYLWELMTKHLQSIKDIVADIDKTISNQKLIDEKFGDAHNYLFLLEGLISERRENAE